MAATKQGNDKARATLVKKHGSEVAYRAYMTAIGRKGGQGSRGYSFGHGSTDPRVIGALGGKSKRRGHVL